MFSGRSIVCAGYYARGSAYPLDPKWVYPQGVGERGGGAGDKGARASLYGKLDNVYSLWYNEGAGLPHNLNLGGSSLVLTKLIKRL